jgi:hypothetical protein
MDVEALGIEVTCRGCGLQLLEPDGDLPIEEADPDA